MSDLALGNLIELKRRLLSSALTSQTTYDSQITVVGRGVAAQFEKFCNRKFGCAIADTYVVPADRSHVYLPRSPVESISSLEQRDTQADGWRTLIQAQAIQQQDNNSGYVYF